MNLKYLIIGIFTILNIDCSSNNKPSFAQIEAQRKADSLQYLAKIHKNFIGRHSHGNTKVHEHQNIPKKRRIMKKIANMDIEAKKALFDKADKSRKKRIKKIMAKRAKEKK